MSPVNSDTTISMQFPSPRPSWPVEVARMHSWAWCCLDEIRGRLAEVFSLKTYKIDPRGARGDRQCSGLRSDAGRDRGADRVRDRHVRRSLHPLASDQSRQGTQRFQGRFGGDFNRGGDRLDAAGDARLPGTEGHLPEPRGDLASIRTDRAAAVPSTWCCRPKATTSPSWACTSSWVSTNTSPQVRSRAWWTC